MMMRGDDDDGGDDDEIFQCLVFSHNLIFYLYSIFSYFIFIYELFSIIFTSNLLGRGGPMVPWRK